MKAVAIHGFGRVGRTTVRTALCNNIFIPKAISDIKDFKTLAALFEVDTNYGRFERAVSTNTNEGMLYIGEEKIPFFDSSQQVPNWKALDIDVVIDCTGRATKREVAQKHIDAGAKRVLVSAPSKSEKDCDAFLLPGINLENFDPEKHRIISMASCTTNALAPVVKVIRYYFGIQRGFFSTVHAYTNTQTLTDQPLADRRDSWDASKNIIPSSSGAAKSLGYIWPDLQGKITGKAYRVPVSTGSIVEFTVELEKATTEKEVKLVFRIAAQNALQGILDVLEEEYASSRIVGDTHSCIIDLPLIQVLDGKLLSIAAWYDNEMGYATRLAETAAYLAQK